MFLEKLTILGKGGIIRDIPFNLRGLNLIVDTTPLGESIDNAGALSGNNVGKTTFIRSIDYCFGSTGRDIYTDKEFKENNSVKEFLIENEVIFKLSLLRKDGSLILLQRSLVAENDLFIDGIKIRNLTDYCKQLNEMLFHVPTVERKLSFRNLIKKFVRSDSYSEGNLYKILHYSASDALYESFYLYLFGFPDQEIISRRLALTESIAKAKKELKKISGTSTLSKVQSRLIVLQKFIDDKELAVKTIDLPSTYDSLISRLRELRSKTGSLSSTLGNLNSKITLSQKTKDELLDSESRIDPDAIRQLYEEAKVMLPAVQRNFEEVLDFHNRMVRNKLAFVEQHIKKLLYERSLVKEELDIQLSEQSRVLSLLDNTGTFDDLIKIREEINILYVEKGKLISQIEEIQKLQAQISGQEIELAEVNIEFSNAVGELNDNISAIFNKYLIQYTTATHDEKLFVFYNAELRKFEFDNLAGNVGDGYKKTEIVAFDFAFISYFNELGLDFPLFVVHDKFEIIHRNQISTIFEIADQLDGQFVLSVLKERISFLNENYIGERTILELSENDKFFRF